MSKWKMVKLGDVAKIQSGYSFKSDEFQKDGVPIIRIGNLDGESVIVDDDICYYKKFWDEHSEFRIYYGDILIAMSGATVGKIGIYEQKSPALLNQRVGKITPYSDKLYNRYLYSYVKAELFLGKIRLAAFGCAQPNISGKQIADIDLPFPPLEEQKRIADILDKARSLIYLRKQQLEKMDLLIKSKFIDMFGDPVTNSKGWEVKTFFDAAIIDTNMTTDFTKYADFPHIGIDSIEKNTGNIIMFNLVKDSNLISGKYMFDNRHIIYSKIRPNLNKVALPSFEGLCSADAYPILPREGINRCFLAYIMRSNFFLDYILSHSDRTNIPKVNKAQLNCFKLPVPPISLQNQFADFVEQVEKQKAVMQQSLEKMETNYKTLMQEYFG